MNKGMELPYTCFDQGVRLKSSFAFFLMTSQLSQRHFSLLILFTIFITH